MITISIGYNCKTKHWKQFGRCAIQFQTPARWRKGFGAKVKTLEQKIMPPWGPECGGKCWRVHKLTHIFLKRKIRVPPRLSRSTNFLNWWLVVSNTHSKMIHAYGFIAGPATNSFHFTACLFSCRLVSRQSESKDQSELRVHMHVREHSVCVCACVQACACMQACASTKLAREKVCLRVCVSMRVCACAHACKRVRLSIWLKRLHERVGGGMKRGFIEPELGSP